MSLYYNLQIRKTRVSPFPGEIVVKEGESVKPDTTILRTTCRLGGICVINVAEHLKVRPEEITEYLLKKEGENIKWQELIAEKKLVMESKEIRSPVDGILERIETQLGMVIIREKLERPEIPVIIDIKGEYPKTTKILKPLIHKKEGDRVQYGETIVGKPVMPMIPFYTNKIVSPCNGTIVKIDYNEGKIWIQKDLPIVELKALYWGEVKRLITGYGIDIEFGGYVLECAYGIGGISWGKLVENDSGDVKGNIIYADYLAARDIEEIIKNRPAGIITGTIDYEEVDILLKNDITLVVIEGFGQMRISEDCQTMIQASLGRNVILNGTTRLRAGVVRPEIIFPSAREYHKLHEREKKFRVTWGKYYGSVGEVKDLLFQGETGSGIKTWLSIFICDDGEKITVPYNNVEEIQ